MNKIQESFGSINPKVLSNLIHLGKVLRLGSFSLLKKSIKKLIMYARLKMKIYHMLLGFMRMIFFKKNSIKKQLNCSVKPLGHLKRSF